MKIKLPLQFILAGLIAFAGWNIYQTLVTSQVSYYKELLSKLVQYQLIVKSYRDIDSQLAVNSLIDSLTEFEQKWKDLRSSFEEISASRPFKRNRELLDTFDSIILSSQEFLDSAHVFGIYYDIFNKANAAVKEQELLIDNLITSMLAKDNAQAKEIALLYEIKSNLYLIANSLLAITSNADIIASGIDRKVASKNLDILSLIRQAIDGDIKSRVDRFRSAKDRRQMQLLLTKYQSFQPTITVFTSNYAIIKDAAFTYKKLETAIAQALKLPQLAQTVNLGQANIFVSLLAIIALLFLLLFIQFIANRNANKKMRLTAKETSASLEQFINQAAPILKNDLNAKVSETGFLEQPSKIFNSIVNKLRQFLFDLNFSKSIVKTNINSSLANISRISLFAEAKSEVFTDILRGIQDVIKSIDVLKLRLSEVENKSSTFYSTQSKLVHNSQHQSKILTSLECKLENIFQGIEKVSSLNTLIKANVAAVVDASSAIRTATINQAIISHKGANGTAMNGLYAQVETLNETVFNKAELLRTDFKNITNLIKDNLEQIRPELKNIRDSRAEIDATISKINSADTDENPLLDIYKINEYILGITVVVSKFQNELQSLVTENNKDIIDIKQVETYIGNIKQQDYEVQRMMAEFTLTYLDQNSSVESVEEIFVDAPSGEDSLDKKDFSKITLTDILEDERKKMQEIANAESIELSQEQNQEQNANVASKTNEADTLANNAYGKFQEYSDTELEKLIEANIADSPEKKQTFEKYIDKIGGDDSTSYDPYSIEALKAETKEYLATETKSTDNNLETEKIAESLAQTAKEVQTTPDSKQQPATAAGLEDTNLDLPEPPEMQKEKQKYFEKIGEEQLFNKKQPGKLKSFFDKYKSYPE